MKRAAKQTFIILVFPDSVHKLKLALRNPEKPKSD